MTIDFSITASKRILLQQVQLAQKKGNRFLYSFPKNRLEHVVNCFKKYFAGFQICVVDGNVIVDENLDGYTNQLGRERKWLADSKQRGDKAECIQRTEETIRQVEESIANLRSDRERLVSFYDDIGSLNFCSEINVSGHKFRLVA